MTNKYYEVISTTDGVEEVLYGSFDRSDCTYELDAGRDGWKDEGYKAIKIKSRDTEEVPDAEVYADSMITSKQLFMRCAPDFNFELSEEQLLVKALEVGFVTKIDGKDGVYMINKEYEGMNSD